MNEREMAEKLSRILADLAVFTDWDRFSICEELRIRDPTVMLQLDDCTPSQEKNNKSRFGNRINKKFVLFLAKYLNDFIMLETLIEKHLKCNDIRKKESSGYSSCGERITARLTDDFMKRVIDFFSKYSILDFYKNKDEYQEDYNKLCERREKLFAIEKEKQRKHRNRKRDYNEY